MVSKGVVLLAIALALCGCTTLRGTSPPRSADEELLISEAADDAAARLAQQLPPNITAYVDSSHFVAEDAAYAVAAIDDQLLKRGVLLTDDKAHASTIIEIRSGALSTNEQSMLLGVPPVTLPFFPIGNILSLPGFDLVRQRETTGIAKFAATAYNPKTGKLLVSTDPQVGVSQQSDWVVLFMFAWSKRDPSLQQAVATKPKVG